MSSSEPESGGPTPGDRAPAPLLAAAGLTFVEGLLTVGFGVTEALAIDADRLTLGVTTAAFFLLYGGALIGCAWGMSRLHSWTRGPVLLAQLIWLGLAWNLRGGESRPVAIAVAVLAALVLAGLLHPRSVEAVERSAGRA